MSVWREVQETLYQRFADHWVTPGPDPQPLTPYALANEKFDPPKAPWAMMKVIRLPGGPGTIGRPGNKRMDRVGLVLIDLREPPNNGVGDLSDLAERAAAIFENCRILSPYDIRFSQVEPGEESDIDKGRWWGVTVEGRFEYEERK